MIIDFVQNLKLYYPLIKNINEVISFIRTNDVDGIEVGDYPIFSDSVFCKVREFETKEQKDCFWEGHREFLDIHFILKGTENIGITWEQNVKEKEYKEEKDLIVADNPEINQMIELNQMNFILFFPGEFHMTSVYATKKENIKKMIVKIKI